MKLKYVRDRRDVYKYDLLLETGRALQLPGGPVVIPMLTPDGTAREGNLRSYKLRHRDRELHTFVQSLERGDVHELPPPATFFTDHHVPTRFVPDGYLEPGARERYFAAVTDLDLTASLVFLDPDTGLEVPSDRSTKYLRYDELRALATRVSERCVLVISQHKHRLRPQRFYELLKERWWEHTHRGHGAGGDG